MRKKDNNLNFKDKTHQNSICQTCQIIRLFLLCVFFIVLIALIQNDKLHYLSFVTPYNAAFLIIFVGLILFIIKLAKYIRES